MEITWKTITLETAKHGINGYNNGSYHGVKNIEIDSQAQTIFSTGLSLTSDGILRQVNFIGKDYGGVAGQPGAIRLAPEIASDIFNDRERYDQTAKVTPPISHKIPPREAIEILYHPFVQQFSRSSKWQVWGSKFWHFLNPDAFPIADSRVNKFFELYSRTNSVEMYMEFLRRFRSFTLSHQQWLPQLREEDGNRAWCDNKLWDKVCYGLLEADSCAA